MSLLLTAQTMPSYNEVLTITKKVNNYWQEKNPRHGRAFWDNAAYHVGNIYAYRLTGDSAYLKYSRDWAERNQWKGAKSDDKATWRLDYGENDNHVLFGDWQICFQVYADLYNIEGRKEPQRIARALEVMGYEISTARNDYWWWADGLYMVMPVMTKLYNLTGNEQYLQKMYEYHDYACSIMYDVETGLYYRDNKYFYPKHKSANGKKDFWARGDGWVFAGLARVIEDLPEDYYLRGYYINKYKRMATAIAACQQEEGYWTRSMLDPEHAPGRETSGTAFFTFGVLWGINHGYLPADKYLPIALKGWSYLSKTAVQADGRLGYVQPIGERAIPGQTVDANSTAPFGVGAFLLAAYEMAQLLK